MSNTRHRRCVHRHWALLVALVAAVASARFFVQVCPMRAGNPLTEQHGKSQATGEDYCLKDLSWKHANVHYDSRHTPTPAPFKVTLKTEGLWAVELVVKDAATNIRKARRFVMYHKDTDVAISERAHVKLTSAGNDGNLKPGDRELWQTSTNQKITANWDKVFQDKETGRWLEPITRAGVHGLEASYDQRVSTTIGDITPGGNPHVDGICRFDVKLTSTTGADHIWPEWRAVKKDGVGRGVPTRIEGIPAVTLDEDVYLVNGHFYSLAVQAYNVYGDRRARQVTFGVDVTPPELVDWGIERDGEKMLVS